MVRAKGRGQRAEVKGRGEREKVGEREKGRGKGKGNRGRVSASHLGRLRAMGFSLTLLSSALALCPLPN
jgi:hypothetical protein